jgi:hypothetical protein
MSNFNLKTDWLSALNEAFGARIGSEIAQSEAERMFFPFYDKTNNFQFLRRHGNELAYVILYGDERCVYEVVDENRSNAFLPLNFVGVEMGELTELGFIPIDNGREGVLVFQPETTPQVDFFSGKLKFTVNSDKAHTNEIKLFGDKVYFAYVPLGETVSGRIVVYAKYKPHGLSFDYSISQSSRYNYFHPYITTGYRLTSLIVNPNVNGNYNFHFYKKAAGDTGNDTQIAATSSMFFTDFQDYKLSLTGIQTQAFITHYRDTCFGGTGTSASPDYKSYRARLTFQKTS